MNKKYSISLVVCGALVVATTAGAVVLEPTIRAGMQVNSSAGLQIKTSDGSEIEVQTEPGDDVKGVVQGGSEELLPTINKKTSAKIEVRGWDATKKATVAAKVDTALDGNPEITDVNVDENTVEIHYSAPAKLLWVFPVTMPLTVTADSNAKVAVIYPWWKFLTSSSFGNTEELLNGIFQHSQTDLEFLTKQASEDRQAQIFSTISNSLKLLKTSYDLAPGKK